MSSGDDDMMYDSDDQDYNYSEDDYAYDDDGDGVSSDEEDDQINSILHKKENFTVLKEEDIEKRQAEDIAEVSSVLQVSDEAACLLLRHYNWKVVEVKDEWFADEEKVRKEAGIIHKLPIDYTLGFGGVICGICFERCESMLSVGCGHLYCKVCWVGYLHTAITDGPGCLMLRCPEPSCYAAVGQDMVDKVGLSEEDKAKYKHYILRTYVENCRTIKWCPAPDCEHAVKFALGCDNYDVVCDCSNAFCWNCAEDAHRPVDCEMVSTWVLKNSSEAENTNWILANSKPCPKCKRPIEKNHGCMHMTCTPPCKFEFCWLCLGDWKQHGEATGGFYACNSYTKAKAAGQLDEDEIKRDMAKQSLERYTHYYERWASNGNSRNKALKELEDMQNVHLLKLSKSQNQPESQLQFCLEAWRQIVECRRVLKWTYAYGFYLPAHELAKKHLFEYLQGQADAALERLHHCAEKELMKYISDDTETGQNTEASKVTEDFSAFRSRLASLTRVTKNFFENLVKALENGLSDVDSQETSLQKGIATIKEDSDGLPHQWACDQCTYMNPPTSRECSVCGVGVAPFEIDQ